MRAEISADRQEHDRVRDSRYSRDNIVIFKRNKAALGEPTNRRPERDVYRGVTFSACGPFWP